MRKNILYFILTLFFLSGLYATSLPEDNVVSGVIYEKIDTVSAEVDHIYPMLALAIVYKDWQEKNMLNKQGHNIGLVIVDENNMPVFWVRNSVHATHNGTQHGEVRLVSNLLNCEGFNKYLDKYTLYTTLEPCIMCAGMLSMVQIPKVVYAQKDLSCGNTQEIISTAKYPRYYKAFTVENGYKKDLEECFEQYKICKNDSITDFLVNDSAKEIFRKASNDLQDYKVKFKENRRVIKVAQEFLQNIQTKDNLDVLQCPKNM
ncbi:hypothetical protein CQA53_08010 [Helicobacter didelphidarum]|uniref:CMP/dCMP-type deaminase domain-containing protein n=1 Tax=Helicobacter didelphidarum TaxID=2040648 RepID=A0A3D8IG27_9HELI|nr:deaminase [Helicobacter didelphidarum]RDU64073.1 hypothetical protein CQA53_08010 [Helicobacter didelphidarum]